MKKRINILLSGAGGASAIGAIKSLRMSDPTVKIIATDSNPLSAGFHLADRLYVVSPSNDKMFMTDIYNIIEVENVDLIMPTSGHDILPLSANKSKLEEMGVTCFFSDYSVVRVCDSKYKFYNMIGDKFPIPTYSLHQNVIEDYPVFVRPDCGKGSRDTYLCHTEESVIHVMAKHKRMLVCEYLPGTEYTIDILSTLDSTPICAIPRERVEVKAGISSKGKVIIDGQIEGLCMTLAGFLRLKGPSCIQMKRDKDGNLKFIEANARMGGGTIMSTLAGVNIPELILKLYNNETLSEDDLTFKDTTVLRYYEEIVISG